MASSRTIVLVTGANGGIGYEVVRQLLADSTKHVLLGSRSLEKGEKALQQLQSSSPSGSVELLQLDVSKPDSISAAAAKISSTHGHIDALVNNAAVASFPETMSWSEKFRQSFETNATGVFLTTEAFAPLLKKSSATPRIVNVSSGAGSIGRRMDSSSKIYNQKAPVYRSSKAAMNMIAAEQAVEYGELGWKVFTYCPGFTVSNLSDFNKAEQGAKPTSEGAKPIVDLLEGKGDEKHGKFVHADGEYPW